MRGRHAGAAAGRGRARTHQLMAGRHWLKTRRRFHNFLPSEPHFGARSDHVLHPVFAAAEGEICLAVNMPEHSKVDAVFFEQLREQRFAVL